jgi:hypothetical protein
MVQAFAEKGIAFASGAMVLQTMPPGPAESASLSKPVPAAKSAPPVEAEALAEPAS